VAQAALDTPKPADFHLDTNGARATPAEAARHGTEAPLPANGNV
jgi:hypothetical protein